MNHAAKRGLPLSVASSAAPSFSSSAPLNEFGRWKMSSTTPRIGLRTGRSPSLSWISPAQNTMSGFWRCSPRKSKLASPPSSVRSLRSSAEMTSPVSFHMCGPPSPGTVTSRPPSISVRSSFFVASAFAIVVSPDVQTRTHTTATAVDPRLRLSLFRSSPTRLDDLRATPSLGDAPPRTRVPRPRATRCPSPVARSPPGRTHVDRSRPSSGR